MKRVNPVYEQLINAPRVGTATATFHLIDTIQRFHENRGLQVGASAILFILLCEHLKVDQQDVFTAAKNLLNSHDDALGTEFEAIREYLKHEVR